MRSGPTSIAGIINVWSNFDQFSKSIEKDSISRRKCSPPKLKLRIYPAGLSSRIPGDVDVHELTQRPRHLRCGRIRLEFIAIRLEAIALRLEAISVRLEAIALRVGGHRS